MMAEDDYGNVQECGNIPQTQITSAIRGAFSNLKSYNNPLIVLNEKMIKLTYLIAQKKQDFSYSTENIKTALSTNFDSEYNDEEEYYDAYKKKCVELRNRLEGPVGKQIQLIKKEDKPKIAEAVLIEFKRLIQNIKNDVQLFGYVFANDKTKFIGSFLVILEELYLDNRGITSHQKISNIIKDNNLKKLCAIIMIDGKINKGREQELMKINSINEEEGVYLIKIQQNGQESYELWKQGNGQIINDNQILVKYVKGVKFYKCQQSV